MERPAAPDAATDREEGTRPRPSREEELIRTCPNCGRPLAERKCKLGCEDPRCGYYLSCADYY